jgi:hypothetical protein
MSEQTIPISRGIDAPAAMPWLVGMAIYLLLITLGSQLLNDPDVYLHVAIGRLIVDKGGLPDTDPFSTTMGGTHYVAYEWLSQVAYALAYRLGGWVAVTALAAASAAAAFGLLTHYLTQRCQPVPALLMVLVALILVSPHILARPHALALPILVAWVAGLVRASDTARPPSLWLLPLMALWANLHGSFVFGLAMIGAIGAEATWQAPSPRRVGMAKSWILFGLLSVAAACVNPYGPEMILATFRTLALSQALSVINEWQPQDFAKLGAFEIVILGAIGFALLRGVKLPLFRTLMLLGVLHLSLSQSRHADLLGMLAPLFLMRPLADQFEALRANPVAESHQRWLPAMAGLLAIATFASGVVAMSGRIAPAANNTPANALAAVQRRPIFNSYEFGDYLDFAGVTPFIDGRTEVYGEAFMLRYNRAVTLQDLPDFLKLLDDYHIETTLLIPQTPAVALLDRQPDWQRVYSDDVAVVHMRRELRKN